MKRRRGSAEVYVHLRRPATARCVMCCGSSGVVVVVVATARRVGCWVVVVVGVEKVVVIAGAGETYSRDNT